MSRQTQSVINRRYVSYNGRYDRFENRILKVKQFFQYLKRHRTAIAISVSAIAIVTVAFIFCCGIFIGEPTCKDIVYGDGLPANASAFLSRVDYQYARTQQEDAWSSSFPTEPGEYYVRGVTVNPFGTARYTPPMRFSLTARSLELSMDVKCQYGDLTDDLMLDSISATGLVKNDIIQSAAFDVEYDGWAKGAVKTRDIMIKNEHNVNVTQLYEISFSDMHASLTQRNVSVQINSHQKVYDGLQWNSPSYEITKGSLVNGHELTIDLPSYSADAGQYELSAQNVSVADGDGNDVTERYLISISSGTLDISPIALRFKTGSASKIYDATPLSEKTWELTDGALLNGHSLSVSNTTELTNVGTVENIPEITIFDSDSNDVTHNYDITFDAGKLTVNPIILNFTTGSARKVYDGTPLTNGECKHTGGNVLDQHSLSYKVTGTITDVGSIDNTLSVTVTDKNGKDVTESGYEIVVDHGTLTIDPRPVTFTSGSAQKYYNRTPLTCWTMEMTSGSLIRGHVAFPTFTGSQLQAGESPNSFSVKILDELGNDETNNYDITYIFGSLSVLPTDYPTGTGGDPTGDYPTGSDGVGDDMYPQIFKPDDQSGTAISYAGTNNTSSFNFATVTVSSDTVSDRRLYLRLASYGDYDRSGFYSADPYTEMAGYSPLDITGIIARSAGVKPSMINIELSPRVSTLIPYYTVESGMFFGSIDTVLPTYLTEYQLNFYEMPSLDQIFALKEKAISLPAELEYREYVYDNYLQIPASTKSALYDIALSNSLVYVDDLQTKIERIASFVQSSAVYDADGSEYPQGVDVAVHFFQAQYGICQHFAAAATMMYRALGIPARYTTGFAKTVENDTPTPLTGQEGHAWVEVYIDSIGWVPIEVTGSSNSGDDNMGGDSMGGDSTLPTTKPRLVLKAYSTTKIYDGMPFDEWKGNKVVISSGSLLPGHTLIAECSEQGKYMFVPATYQNKITSVKIVDGKGNDVTDHYNLVLMSGQMTIKRRELVIQFGSATKTYDGEPLTCDEWWLLQGSLVPGDKLKITTGDSITEVGTFPNRPFEVSVYDDVRFGYKTNVTLYYYIRIINGNLTVLPSSTS